ncbi:MAG: pilus assembly protein PilM [Lentisphaerae bacterium]|nr:pilus assembly protein PilM [Lentisphaerota bacterium]
MATNRKTGVDTSVIIEIGNDWLKIVQIDGTSAGRSISRIHLERIESLNSAVTQTVSKAFKSQKFASVPVIACLPKQVVNIRMLDLPSTEAGEIADMIELQIGKQTPYSRDEITFDYKTFSSERSGYTKVMLAIVQRSILRQRYSILEDAGLDIARVSVSSEGLLNWYNIVGISPGGGACVAVLDVDSFCSDFIVMYNGGAVFTRSIQIGANHLQQEEQKWLDKFAREMKQFLEAFQTESPGSRAEKIILTGAGERIKGLADCIRSQSGLEVGIVSGVKGIKEIPKSTDLESGPNSTVSLTPLVGMGLEPDKLEFNLVPEAVVLRKMLVSKAKSLTVFTMMVMTMLVAFSLFGVTKFFVRKTRLLRIDAELVAKEPAVREMNRMSDICAVVRRRQDARFAMVNLLAEIHPTIPDNMYLDSLDIDIAQRQLILSGTAESSKDARLLVKTLEQSPLFENVSEAAAITKDQVSGRFKFRIACALEVGQ